MSPLFREEALQAHRPQSLGTIRLATPVSQQIWGVAAAATTIAIVLWLCLGHYTRREHVTGALVPQAGLLNVTARSAGTITRLDIDAGTSVREGAPLLTMSSDRSSIAMGDTDAIVDAQLRTQEAQTRGTRRDGSAPSRQFRVTSKYRGWWAWWTAKDGHRCSSR